MDKEEAVKAIATLIQEAGLLMNRATALADKHGISYEPYNFDYDEENDDYLVGNISNLARWNSSSCY